MINEVQFSDDAHEDKTKAPVITAADVKRLVNDHTAECLAILGFASVDALAAAYALVVNDRNSKDVKIRGLTAALEERRFQQSQHKELRDEWAMSIYNKGGTYIEECYALADKAIKGRYAPTPEN